MALSITKVDYTDPVQGAHLLDLLDSYARDPMGGGQPLSHETKANLLAKLAAQPTAFSLIAYAGGEPAGLANCFFGFSTFAAKPLINIHDVVVKSEYRGKGIGKALFAEIEQIAVRENACKVTLEVLSENHPAKALYASLGYGDYNLNPESGTALFWEKRIAA